MARTIVSQEDVHVGENRINAQVVNCESHERNQIKAKQSNQKTNQPKQHTHSPNKRSWEEASNNIPHLQWTGSDLIHLAVSPENSVGWNGFKHAPTPPRDVLLRMCLRSRTGIADEWQYFSYNISYMPTITSPSAQFRQAQEQNHLPSCWRADCTFLSAS